MTAFRVFLVIVWTAVVAYTAVTIAQDGWNFFPTYFGDLAEMKWRGQFDADFTGFLMLSAIWVMWRHHFSATGILLGLIASIGGIVFLAAYLLIASFQMNGDITALLLGERRTT